MERLEEMEGDRIWEASRLVTGPAADGGEARIPTLVEKDPTTGRVVEKAADNKGKSKMLYGETSNHPKWT